MFGLGMWEILIILVLALIFIGPKKLPDLARTLGRGLREFRNAASEIRVDFQRMDEAEETRKKSPAALPAVTGVPDADKDKPAVVAGFAEAAEKNKTDAPEGDRS